MNDSMRQIIDAGNRARVIGVLLFVLTLALFVPAVHYDYVKLDDDGYVAQNHRVATGLRADNIRWAFTSVHEGWWLPALWISFMGDAEVFGHRPFGYHLTNIVLHAANAALLFGLLFRMTGSLWGSAFAAAFFAWHPLRVEAVAWITSRKDVLSGLFFFLSLLAYTRYAEQPGRKRFAWVAGGMVLGGMSKPILFILPPILLLLDFWPLKRMGDPLARSTWKSLWPLIQEKLPLFGLSAALIAGSLYTHAKKPGSLPDLSYLERFALIFPNMWEYIGKIVWPTRLVAPYPEDYTVSWPVAAVSCALFFLVTGWFVRQRNTRPYLIVGWLWFLIGIITSVRGVRVGIAIYADRFTYLPSIGIGLIAAWSTAEILRKKHHLRAVSATCGAVVLAACVWLTHQQMPVWRDSLSLYSQLARLFPEHAVAHNNVGRALLEKGQVASSLEPFKRAASLDPANTLAAANYGDALIRLDRQEEAAAWLRVALLERGPDDPALHLLLGLAYLNQDRADVAIPHLRRAVQLQPMEAGWRIELIRAYFEDGLPEQAEDDIRFLEARGFPGFWSMESLFSHYARLWRGGERDHAWRFFRHALHRHPDHELLLGQAAWLVAIDPEPPVPASEALRLARHALTLNGSNQLLLLDVLAAAYAANGLFDEAQQVAEEALRLAHQSGLPQWASRIAERLSAYRAHKPWRD